MVSIAVLVTSSACFNDTLALPRGNFISDFMSYFIALVIFKIKENEIKIIIRLTIRPKSSIFFN